MEYDAFAECQPGPRVTLIQAQWAEVLATDVGMRLAANLLRQSGLAQPVVTEADRIRHNEAVNMLGDMMAANPGRAADVVLLAILPHENILPRPEKNSL